MENPDHKTFLETGKLSADAERFSALSSEIAGLLRNILVEIDSSAKEIRDEQTALDLKRRELEMFRDLQESANMLERQIEDLRKQKEELERAISDQLSAWGVEKAAHERQEKEYAENLETVRRREEEEYRRMREGENIKSMRMLEDELNAARRMSLREQEAAEEDLRKRDLRLRQKEQECGQLIRELEQFMAGVAKRAGARTERKPAEPGFNLAGHVAERPEFFEHAPPPGEGFSPADSSMWHSAWERKEPLPGEEKDP